MLPQANAPAEIVGARVVDGTIVRLSFADGFESTVDLRPLMSGPVFDEVFEGDGFGALTVDPDLATIVWPNGADLDPDVLRDAASAKLRKQLSDESVVFRYIFAGSGNSPKWQAMMRTVNRAGRDDNRQARARSRVLVTKGGRREETLIGRELVTATEAKTLTLAIEHLGPFGGGRASSNRGHDLGIKAIIRVPSLSSIGQIRRQR